MPSHTIPEADDKVALVVHLLGGGHPEGSLLRQDKKLVLCGSSGDRSAFLFPVG